MVLEEDLAGSVTAGQIASILAYLTTLILWLVAEYNSYSKRLPGKYETADTEVQLLIIPSEKSDRDQHGSPPIGDNGEEPQGIIGLPKDSAWGLNQTFLKCLILNGSALQLSLPTLCAAAEFGSLIMLFYVVDRTPIFAPTEKYYVRDTFIFLLLVLTAVAAGYSLKEGRGPSFLNRQQTEEWKGWMQVFFLLYHYFKASEVYNAIRICIAAYVWMTGYGNFSYYYKTNDFSIGRFCQMMWRLNFLVTVICLALGNSLMLYYICPMHTLWTIAVYAVLGLGSKYNSTAIGIWTKIALCTLAVAVCWEIRPIFDIVWAPFELFLRYSDPRRPVQDEMHEWYFRSGLDRYIWIYGMICAYIKPTVEGWLKTIDAMADKRRRYGMRGAIIAACCVITAVWYTYVYSLPKVLYNGWHPFTSWIPISIIIILRNLTPLMRTWNMTLYGWLGCITLETYISQYHIWMLTKVPDGQPIYLLTLIAGYPLLNFAAVTSVYIFVSYRLFSLTVTLRDAFVPHDNNSVLMRNALTLAAVSIVLLGMGFVVSFLYK